MHLHINSHRQSLTQGSSYIKLPELIAKKKAVLNPKNNNEECFKWAVIAALHHKEIENNLEPISKPQHYEYKYN